MSQTRQMQQAIERQLQELDQDLQQTPTPEQRIVRKGKRQAPKQRKGKNYQLLCKSIDMETATCLFGTDSQKLLKSFKQMYPDSTKDPETGLMEFEISFDELTQVLEKIEIPFPTMSIPLPFPTLF